jgi:hypothetical protein
MSDEQVDSTEIEEPKAEIQYSPIELQAMEMGWRPKTEFTGNDEDWKGAGAFIKDAELFSSLKKQDNQLKELRSVVEELRSHLTKADQAGYTRAIKELEAQRKTAMENFDIDALTKADDAYIALQKELANKTPTVVEPVQTFVPKSQEELDFEVRNGSWYNDNTPINSLMKQEAIALSKAIFAANPTLPNDKLLAELEKSMQRLHPDAFKNTKRVEPATVDAGGPTKKASSDTNLADIDPDLKAIAQSFVKQGIYKSVKDYIDEVKKSGAI